MKVSIITPFYKGNKYINRYLKNVANAVKNSKNEVEIILVNDSPNYEIEYNEDLLKNLDFKIVNNATNQGIQKSRINGLNKAKGEYIIFLDQDDELTANSIDSQIESFNEDTDVVVGNGYEEQKDGKLSVIIKNKVFAKWTISPMVYYKSRNFIISPGMCMIKKTSIPNEWKEKNLSVNGADDYYLWLLLFKMNKRFVFNEDFIYVHKYTGENVSNNLENMHNSQLEMLQYLKENLSEKELKTLSKTIEFKYYYKSGNKKVILKYPCIYLFNVFCSTICNKFNTIKGDKNDIDYLSN